MIGNIIMATVTISIQADAEPANAFAAASR
jgi:hypothetical protein